MSNGTDSDSEEGCGCCSRRGVLKAVGAFAVVGPTLVTSGCNQTSGQPLENGTAQSCSGGLCIDLTDPANAALKRTDGFLAIDAPNGDTLAVVRSGSDTVTAVSAVCTHQGCLMDYDSHNDTLVCPCHGSEFATDGNVLRGPARRRLPVYTATVSSDTITIVGA